jgi:hypothetical protein
MNSALDGVSQRHAPAALYPQGKDPRYQLDRTLGGPQSRSGHRGWSKNSLFLHQGSNLDSPVAQSVARHYTDWATPVPFYSGVPSSNLGKQPNALIKLFVNFLQFKMHVKDSDDGELQLYMLIFWTLSIVLRTETDPVSGTLCSKEPGRWIMSKIITHIILQFSLANTGGVPWNTSRYLPSIILPI